MGLSTMVLVLALQNAYPPSSVQPLSGADIAGLPVPTSHICVDQFGYLPDEEKVAVVSDPQVGYNSFDHYSPGPKLELRTKDGKTVFTGSPTPWKNGAVHEDSGDRGWWFDFSSIQKPGEYYVFDPANARRSALVRIGSSVFEPVLKAATRMYHFQRLGIPITAEYAKGPWVDAAGLPQDSHARSVEAKDSNSLERDMSGGWMDAGDTDKYPPFNGDVVHPLLYAYTNNPKAFTDQFGIPESGNGLPDILDEIKYQVDWLLRMQFPDGSVPVKMGNIDYNGKYPLSQDLRPRYYGPQDSGATIYTCAIFAHAARVFGHFPAWQDYAKRLSNRALKAWEWYKANPRTYNTDTGEIKSGIANRTADEQDRMEAYAAVHLFALTHEQRFQDAILAKAGKSRQLAENIWSPYEAGASESLIDYMTVPGADPGLVGRIREQLAKSAESDHFAPPVDADLYRAWMEPTNYHWGSNIVRASWGVVCLLAAEHGGLTPSQAKRLRARAADMLHSFHGVNPLSVVYLSNMGSYGAEHSVTSIYHTRYGDGTPFSKNPPPGYVVGGPNSSYTGRLDWVKKQPRAKSYADFNAGYPDNSWEITEPAIYYQAMYVRLVSAFAHVQ